MSAASAETQQMEKALEMYHVASGLAFKMTSTDRVVLRVRLFDNSEPDRFIEFETTMLLAKEESNQITLPVVSSIKQRLEWEKASRNSSEGEFTMYLADVDGARKFNMVWRRHDGYNFFFDSPYINKDGTNNWWAFSFTSLNSATHALTMTGHEWSRHLDMQEILTNEATRARLPLAMRVIKEFVLNK